LRKILGDNYVVFAKKIIKIPYRAIFGVPGVMSEFIIQSCKSSK